MTRGWRTWQALAWPLVTVAILSAACSSDSDDEPAATETSTAPTAVLTTPTSGAAATETPAPSPTPEATSEPLPRVEYFSVPADSRPHDVAPAVDGSVWYTAQGSGELGYLDPATGEVREIPLGAGSSPHGVIVGPDGAPWITDSGLNAIVRVDPETEDVQVFPLPSTHRNANLNTAAFDGNGILWFTGQNGVIGRLDPATGAIMTWDAPRGRGPYGIDATPDGRIFYASLAGNHIAEIDPETAEVTVIDPPTAGQGARRVWSDSQGRIWVSEWNSGQLSRYDPVDGSWEAWPLPGSAGAQTYAVYVDERDIVWVSDFSTNTLLSFDPGAEEWTAEYELPYPNSNIRQILGREGEVWAPLSGAATIMVVRPGQP